MRLRSEIWVQAYLRRIQAEGAAGYVMRRGDANAGTILICVSSDLGLNLLTPVPSEEGDDGERVWRQRISAAPESHVEVKKQLDRELSFDPDIWVIEIEDRRGRHFLGENFRSDGDLN